MLEDKKDVIENETNTDENVSPEEESKLEEIEEGIVPGLRDTDLSFEVRNSFLDYAMSVIVSRAITVTRSPIVVIVIGVLIVVIIIFGFFSFFWFFIPSIFFNRWNFIF